MGRYVNRKNNNVGSVKKKILLLLAAGVALGAAKTMGKQFKILGELSKEWKKIRRTSLTRSLDSLYTSKLIHLRPKGDSMEIALSFEGKKLVQRFNLDTLEIRTQEDWDGKWRIVMFDVPERIKKVRDALRFHFKEIGLVEYQKSVFITPYPCEKEIKFISEFYNVSSSVKFVVAEAISDQRSFERKFRL